MKRISIIATLALAGLILVSSAFAQKAPVYIDGTYALDYKDAELGSVSVSVTVLGGKLASVTFPAGMGDAAMEDAPLADWLATFVAAPNFMDVDAVSGASQSCDLIKYAVQNALKKAVVK
jgi:uncharacterized protein with FMN-binding domain